MLRKKGRGWFGERKRHSDAARGIPTKPIQKRGIVPRGAKWFYGKLRSLGFKREFVYRSVYPGNRVAQYTKRFENVDVRVQLFDVPTSDYAGRISHFHHGHTPFGIMDSRPSTFKTVDGMVEAINFEKTRYEKGISKRVEKHF